MKVHELNILRLLLFLNRNGSFWVFLSDDFSIQKRYDGRTGMKNCEE